MKAITAMSPEEIKQAQRQILEALGGEHSGALQKFKTNFGKSAVGKAEKEVEELEEIREAPEGKAVPLETG